MKPISALILYAQDSSNTTFSYQYGWPRKFLSHPRFRCEAINVRDGGWEAFLHRYRVLECGEFDVIIILHSVFSNACYLRWRHLFFHAIKMSRVPKVYFIGNEYKLMPEKMAFCDALGISLLVSQSDLPAVHALYKGRLGCAVAGIPSAGLDKTIFYPTVPWRERLTDIGYRSDESPIYLGHTERRDIAEYVSTHGPQCGLKVDISLKQSDRFGERGWAEFLNQCKGQLGTEAGGDYFELTDETRIKYRDYIAANPCATDDEIISRFFKGYVNPIPMRVITGRIVEAAATKTVQVLFEGHYSGYFKPDIHYIPLRKDFKNFAEVVEKFRDENYCRAVTENAYELVLRELTYDKLIDKFCEALDSCL